MTAEQTFVIVGASLAGASDPPTPPRRSSSRGFGGA